MLTRSEFRQLFGLPKKRRTLTKKSSSKVTKKSSTRTSKPVRKTASKTVSKVGKKVVRKTSTKLGKKIVAGKLRTIYKSKNGSKYYKKVSKGKVYRPYLGKPVLRKTRSTRFGYQNTTARSLGGLMGPADLSANSVNVVAKKAPATAAFGKRRRRTTRFGYVSGSARNLTGMMGPYPLTAANGSAIPSSFGKKRRVAAKKPVRKTAAKKPVRKTATKAGKKVVRKTAAKKPVRRSSRFGLMHGRPSQLASGPYPF